MFAPPSSGSASSIRSRSTTTTTPGTHTRTSTGRRITSSIRPGASATSTSVRGTTTRPSATSGCYSRPVEAVPCHPIHAGNIGVRLYVRLALRLLRWTALLVGTAVPTLPLAQEACELGGERLARGQVFLGIELLGPLLELGHVSGRLLVRCDRVRDLLAVPLRRLVELGNVDRRSEDVSEPLAQRERRTRTGREGDVMRNRCPQAHRWDARIATGVVQDPDDSRRTFVAGALETEALDQLGIRGAAGDRRGARVRHVREQGSERDHQLYTKLTSETHHHPCERLPAEVGLDPEEEHRVAVDPRDRRVVEGVLGPFDASRRPFDERDVRSRRLEVEESLRLDFGEALRLPGLGEVAAGE